MLATVLLAGPAGKLPVTIPANLLARLRPHGLLLSPWLAVGMGSVAILVGTITVARIRRRRRADRGVRGVAGVGGATVLIAVSLATATAVNSFVGYIPTIASLGQLAGVTSLGQAIGSPAVAGSLAATGMLANGWPVGVGRTVSFNLGDPGLGVPVSTGYVYLPPGYDSQPDRHYPVVYLLHGFPGGAQDWMRAGRVADTMNLLVANHVLPPMIIVAPDVNGGRFRDGGCLNAVGGPQITTYLLRDVLGWVDSHLRTLISPAQRAIGGMSSGGYCALDIGLRATGLFGVLLAFQPYGDPGLSVLPGILAGRTDVYRAHSPTVYLPFMTFVRRPAIFLDSGDASRAEVRRVRALYQLIAARKLDAAFRIETGQSHTWLEARAGLPWGLLFAARHFPDTTAPAGARPSIRLAGTAARTVHARWP